jgi:hypothetical protein
MAHDTGGGTGHGGGAGVLDGTAATISAQRARAESIADVLARQRASAPHIDPSEWRGLAAGAEHAAAERMLEAVGAASNAADDACAALREAEAVLGG